MTKLAVFNSPMVPSSRTFSVELLFRVTFLRFCLFFNSMEKERSSKFLVLVILIHPTLECPRKAINFR